jgi:hypothetical protein
MENGSLDFLYISKIISKRFVFDDAHFKEGLIGIYGTYYFPEQKLGVDYYALNFQSGLRKYNSKSGFETRNTFGVRFFSKFSKVNFETETAYQTGKFSGLTIRAYSALADINFTVFSKIGAVIGLGANIASGDKSSNDHILNTYNLLYAKPAYGLAIPLGSTNLSSLYSYLRLNPIPKLNLLAQVFLLSKMSNEDGMYSPAMLQVRPKTGKMISSENKSLGVFYLFESNYRISNNLSFSLDYSWFRTGSSIKSTGNGKDLSYVSFKTTLKI